jgi:two-component system OmpR family response regulator
MVAVLGAMAMDFRRISLWRAPVPTNYSDSMKILLVEDDAETAAYIANGLREHGHVVDLAETGRDGLFLATEAAHDVAVVDRMLPGMDGLAMVKAVRAADIKLPILFLTTMGGIDDRVEGLNAGADDYLVKPFAFSELLARINALSRRPVPVAHETTLNIGDLELDLLKRLARRDGKTIELQPQEFRLLEFLMRHADQVVTRTMLLEHVWDFHFDPQTNIVETNISRLRSKIDKGFDRELIHTIRGAGYALRTPE